MFLFYDLENHLKKFVQTRKKMLIKSSRTSVRLTYNGDVIAIKIYTSPRYISNIDYIMKNEWITTINMSSATSIKIYALIDDIHMNDLAIIKELSILIRSIDYNNQHNEINKIKKIDFIDLNGQGYIN